MSKKTFTDGIESLIPTAGKRGRPVKNIRPITKSSQEGLPENEVRATFIVKEDALDKLKAIAYWDRKLIREVHTEAIGQYIAAYEKKNGPVQPIPGK